MKALANAFEELADEIDALRDEKQALLRGRLFVCAVEIFTGVWYYPT